MRIIEQPEDKDEDSYTLINISSIINYYICNNSKNNECGNWKGFYIRYTSNELVDCNWYISQIKRL